MGSGRLSHVENDDVKLVFDADRLPGDDDVGQQHPPVGLPRSAARYANYAGRRHDVGA